MDHLDRAGDAEGRPWISAPALVLEILGARRFVPTSPPDEVLPEAPEPAGGRLYPAFASGRYIRAVNFHATPARLAEGMEAQLSWVAERFVSVNYGDLFGLLTRGEWPHEKPGVVVSFFDGFRDNFEVAAPILEGVGLTGWFFVVPGWVAAPPEGQRAFADSRFIDLSSDPRDTPADGRLAMTPEEVGVLAGRGHEIVSHTRTHASPDELGLSPEALISETAGSKRDLESLTGRPVRALAWHTGAPLGTDPRADEALRSAGYELLFANRALQRL